MNNFRIRASLFRNLSGILKHLCFLPSSSGSSIVSTGVANVFLAESLLPEEKVYVRSSLFLCRSLVRKLSTTSSGTLHGPTAIDHRSLLNEDEFHNLANNTILNLQEKFEEYGDAVQIDGFDVEYSNEVLTVKLGHLGTYVLNKQAPNRQLWLSSPVSGPSRYDWDADVECWIYRRTGENLLRLLEKEFVQLCGDSINLG